MDLQRNFHDFIEKERLFTPDDRLLLAVSGGVDSVALCELFHLSGLSFVIAHCNFGLRGEESLRDEEFVRRLADRYHRDILVKTFDTTVVAADRQLSVQAAARELRYTWFSELVRDGIARYVVTAHQLDDNIETLLMNFFKGTGIAGLRGMLPRQGIVVRPLLFAGRADILEFVHQRGLVWVEDSSNFEDKYTRNFFRHQLIPLVEKAYPAATRNLAGNIGRFRAIELIYRDSIDRQKKKIAGIPRKGSVYLRREAETGISAGDAGIRDHRTLRIFAASGGCRRRIAGQRIRQVSSLGHPSHPEGSQLADHFAVGQ